MRRWLSLLFAVAGATYSTRNTVTVAIMSCSRMAHLELALQLIEQQDYGGGKLELVVVADGPAAKHMALPRLLRTRYSERLAIHEADAAVRPPSVSVSRRSRPATTNASAVPSRVRLVLLPGGPYSIGHKRNVAAATAGGLVVVHWDDDDLYGPERVRLQSQPILAGQVDMTFLEGSFLGMGGLTYRYTPEHRGGTFMGSMAYRRTLVKEHAFPDCSLGEDFDVAERATRACRKTLVLTGVDSVYTRSNTSTSWLASPATGMYDPAKPEIPTFAASGLLATYMRVANLAAAKANYRCTPAHNHNAEGALEVQFFLRKKPSHCDAETHIRREHVAPSNGPGNRGFR